MGLSKRTGKQVRTVEAGYFGWNAVRFRSCKRINCPAFAGIPDRCYDMPTDNALDP
jgi:hypothetical protein